MQMENSEFTLIHYLLKIIPSVSSTPLFFPHVWHGSGVQWVKLFKEGGILKYIIHVWVSRLLPSHSLQTCWD